MTIRKVIGPELLPIPRPVPRYNFLPIPSEGERDTLMFLRYRQEKKPYVQPVFTPSPKRTDSKSQQKLRRINFLFFLSFLVQPIELSIWIPSPPFPFPPPRARGKKKSYIWTPLSIWFKAKSCVRKGNENRNRKPKEVVNQNEIKKNSPSMTIMTNPSDCNLK